MVLFDDNNLLSFVFTFLPALIYALIVYFSFPKNCISLRSTFLYFLMGILSGWATSAFLWIFPNWQYPMFGSHGINMLVLSFVQIGLLEEGMKFGFYKLTEAYRKKRPHPAAIIFYCMSVSAGFAVMENLAYVIRYGSEVLWVRSTSAIVLHMITGIMMGYIISLGMYARKIKLYEILAVLVASFFHGLYDFNIFISVTPWGTASEDGINIWYVLSSGLLCAFLMFHHINGKRFGQFGIRKSIAKIYDKLSKRL